MKRRLLASLIALWLAGCQARQKDLSGTWRGTAQIGKTSLRMVTTFKQASDGSYLGTFESPDQSADKLAMDQVAFKDDSVHFDVNSIGFSLDGHLSGDGKKIEATWKQHGLSMPITLTKD